MASVFTQASLDFLAEAPGRDLQWLEENRPSYDEHLKRPMRSLIHALTPAMQQIDPALTGSPSRIQRDLRFHPQQSPLRGSAWVTFQNRRLPPAERPAFFFELYPDRYRYGVGFYAAGTAKMERFRQSIDGDPAAFARLVSALPPALALMGDGFKRSRAGHLPTELRSWYDRKSLWVQVERPIDSHLLSPGLTDLLETEWQQGAELYRFLLV